jgi:hypothetical protein
MRMVNIPTAQIGECSDFVDINGTKSKKSIVITPLWVTVLTEDATKISFGCNYWKSCQNTACSYCQASMGKWEA